MNTWQDAEWIVVFMTYLALSDTDILNYMMYCYSNTKHTNISVTVDFQCRLICWLLIQLKNYNSNFPDPQTDISFLSVTKKTSSTI